MDEFSESDFTGLNFESEIENIFGHVVSQSDPPSLRSLPEIPLLRGGSSSQPQDNAVPHTSRSTQDSSTSCPSCDKYKMDMQRLDEEHRVNFQFLKKKIIKTDLLIRRFKTRQDEVEVLSKTIESLKQKLEQSTRDSSILSDQLTAAVESIKPLQEKISELESQLRKKSLEIDDLNTTIAAEKAFLNQKIALDEETKNIQNTVDSLKKQVTALENKKQKLTTRTTELEDLREVLKGENKTCKRKIGVLARALQQAQTVINEQWEMLLANGLKIGKGPDVIPASCKSALRNLENAEDNTVDGSSPSDMDSDDPDFFHNVLKEYGNDDSNGDGRVDRKGTKRKSGKAKSEVEWQEEASKKEDQLSPDESSDRSISEIESLGLSDMSDLDMEDDDRDMKISENSKKQSNANVEGINSSFGNSIHKINSWEPPDHPEEESSVKDSKPDESTAVIMNKTGGSQRNSTPSETVHSTSKTTSEGKSKACSMRDSFGASDLELSDDEAESVAEGSKPLGSFSAVAKARHGKKKSRLKTLPDVKSQCSDMSDLSDFDMADDTKLSSNLDKEGNDGDAKASLTVELKKSQGKSLEKGVKRLASSKASKKSSGSLSDFSIGSEDEMSKKEGDRGILRNIREERQLHKKKMTVVPDLEKSSSAKEKDDSKGKLIKGFPPKTDQIHNSHLSESDEDEEEDSDSLEMPFKFISGECDEVSTLLSEKDRSSATYKKSELTSLLSFVNIESALSPLAPSPCPSVSSEIQNDEIGPGLEPFPLTDSSDSESEPDRSAILNETVNGHCEIDSQKIKIVPNDKISEDIVIEESISFNVHEADSPPSDSSSTQNSFPSPDTLTESSSLTLIQCSSSENSSLDQEWSEKCPVKSTDSSPMKKYLAVPQNSCKSSSQDLNPSMVETLSCQTGIQEPDSVSLGQTCVGKQSPPSTDDVQSMLNVSKTENTITPPQECVKEVLSTEKAENEIPSPQENECEALSSQKDENNIAFPLITENEIASPLITENEIASPLISENEIASPLISENEIASPQTAENNTLSPQKTENDIVSPQKTQNRMPSTQGTECQITSPLETEKKIPQDGEQQVAVRDASIEMEAKISPDLETDQREHSNILSDFETKISSHQHKDEFVPDKITPEVIETKWAAPQPALEHEDKDKDNPTKLDSISETTTSSPQRISDISISGHKAKGASSPLTEEPEQTINTAMCHIQVRERQEPTNKVSNDARGTVKRSPSLGAEKLKKSVMDVREAALPKMSESGHQKSEESTKIVPDTGGIARSPCEETFPDASLLNISKGNQQLSEKSGQRSSIRPSQLVLDGSLSIEELAEKLKALAKEQAPKIDHKSPSPSVSIDDKNGTATVSLHDQSDKNTVRGQGQPSNESHSHTMEEEVSDNKSNGGGQSCGKEREISDTDCSESKNLTPSLNGGDECIGDEMINSPEQLEKQEESLSASKTDSFSVWLDYDSSNDGPLLIDECDLEETGPNIPSSKDSSEERLQHEKTLSPPQDKEHEESEVAKEPPAGSAFDGSEVSRQSSHSQQAFDVANTSVSEAHKPELLRQSTELGANKEDSHLLSSDTGPSDNHLALTEVASKRDTQSLADTNEGPEDYLSEGEIPDSPPETRGTPTNEDCSQSCTLDVQKSFAQLLKEMEEFYRVPPLISPLDDFSGSSSKMPVVGFRRSTRKRNSVGDGVVDDSVNLVTMRRRISRSALSSMDRQNKEKRVDEAGSLKGRLRRKSTEKDDAALVKKVKLIPFTGFGSVLEAIKYDLRQFLSCESPDVDDMRKEMCKRGQDSTATSVWPSLIQAVIWQLKTSQEDILCHLLKADTDAERPPARIYVGEAERRLIRLVLSFIQHEKGIAMSELMEGLWYAVFDRTDTHLNARLALCRVFTGLCKEQDDQGQVKNLLFHVACCGYLDFPRCFVSAVGVWPFFGDLRPEPRPTSGICLAFEFMFNRLEEKNAVFHGQVSSLLESSCKWKLRKPNSTAEELLKKLLNMIHGEGKEFNPKAFEAMKGVELLLSCMGAVWTQEHFLQRFVVSVVSSWRYGKEDGVPQHRLTAVFQITRSFLAANKCVSEKTVKLLLSQAFSKVIEKKTRIQELEMALGESLMEVAHFQPPRCLELLASWQENNKDIIPNHILAKLIQVRCALSEQPKNEKKKSKKKKSKQKKGP